MNARNKCRLLAGLACLAVLAGCSDDQPLFTPPPTAPAPPPPAAPPPPGSVSSMFGAGFQMAFEQHANAEPRNPADGDIIAIDFTSDPVDIGDPDTP